MQLIPYEIVIIYSIPSILIGMGMGYYLGQQSKMSGRSRIGLGIVLSMITGLVVALLISTIREGTSIHYLLSMLSSLGGALFGMAAGWTPTPHRYVHHVIYEYEDEDEFDHEIEEALRGSEEE